MRQHSIWARQGSFGDLINCLFDVRGMDHDVCDSMANWWRLFSRSLNVVKRLWVIDFKPFIWLCEDRLELFPQALTLIKDGIDFCLLFPPVFQICSLFFSRFQGKCVKGTQKFGLSKLRQKTIFVLFTDSFINIRVALIMKQLLNSP